MDFILKIITGIFVVVVLSLIEGVFVMLLWNWLMPVIFGLVTINFWQGVGLSLLSNFLFGSKISTAKD